MKMLVVEKTDTSMVRLIRIEKPAPAMVVKALGRAAEIIEQGWCKHHSAINEWYNQVSPGHPQAVRWCLVGALARAAGELVGIEHYDEVNPEVMGILVDAEEAVAQQIVQVTGRDIRHIGHMPVLTDYNDDHDITRGDVLAVLQAAKERMERDLPVA